MTDRGPDQDRMPVGEPDDEMDATYRDASYLGTDEEDEEEVRDLGFIVEDHDDRRLEFPGPWERLDDLDTDEALETNPTGAVPHERALIERGLPPEAFAIDYNVSHAAGERQEEDFVETSMLETDPDAEVGVQDDTDETIVGEDGQLLTTGITGQVPGVVRGLGTAVPQDAGLGSFEISDNPLMQPVGEPVSGEKLSDEALGLRDVDEMGSEADLDRLADQAARAEERAPSEATTTGRTQKTRKRKGKPTRR
jgi:hypothetical protein